MPLPKPPPSGQPPMPQMRRKSSIRTAAAPVQEQLLERVRAVADDPLTLLPDIVGDEPAAIARLRRDLERCRDGKGGFLARRGKGIVAAAWACKEIAGREDAPRLLDARVDGNRRFFLSHGHIRPPVLMGVQNADDPLALMAAYEEFATGGLHFFAGDRLWCTGATAAPPQEWFDGLARRTEVALQPDAKGGVHCGHLDRAAVLHILPDGPGLRVCGACLRKSEFPQAVAARVRNPAGRRPFETAVVLPDGTRLEVAKATDALYRVGQASGQDVIDGALATWHAGQSGPRFILGDKDFGTNHDAFLAGFDLPEWEVPAVRAMTAGGHAGPRVGLADLLAAHRDRLGAGVTTLLGDASDDFLRRHRDVEPRTMLRLAHDEKTRRERTADLPELSGLGPLGAWVDGLARARRLETPQQVMARLRKAATDPGRAPHAYAFVTALGGDPMGEVGYSHDQKEAGRSWAPLAREVLESSGETYRAAVSRYLVETGSGETVA